MAFEAEGKLSTLSDGTVDITSGTITIDQITSNNRALHVGEQTGIAKDALTTVTTMPANGIKYITKIHCSGEESARWDIYLDSVRIGTLRTTDRNVSWDFNLPLKILAAEVLDVKVTHHGPDSTADFQATIFGYQD